MTQMQRYISISIESRGAPAWAWRRSDRRKRADQSR